MFLTPEVLTIAFVLLICIYYVFGFFQNRLLWRIPGPFLAKFSSIWLFYQARSGQKYKVVDSLHKKLGPLVRIQPHHVSVADVEAVGTIYGHGNNFLKSEFYDAFVSTERGMFSTRDKAEHTRKRRLVAHVFSARAVSEFEQYMEPSFEDLIKQWDRIAHKKGSNGFAMLDLLPWMNYLAFDIISNLSFGEPFGMVKRGEDVAEIRMTAKSPITKASAIRIFSARSELNAAMGCFPYLKPFARYIPDPFVRRGALAGQKVSGMGVAQVVKRLENGNEAGRVDLLARLMEGTDTNGEKLKRNELIAEALTQLVAGSDTMSNSLCALLFHCLQTPEVKERLQRELDEVLPNRDCIPEFGSIKQLSYLRNVIKETLRVHSTGSSGLPRIVPPGPGIKICGHVFAPGTVVSVPAYTLHHSVEIWGPDANEFRPDRWDSVTETQKRAFIPFSIGPRACSGRNLAEMQLALTTALIFNRYDFVLYEKELQTREGFLRKPLRCLAGIKRR